MKNLLHTTTTPAVDQKTGYRHDRDIMFMFELRGGPLVLTTPWMRGPPEYMERVRGQMAEFIDAKIIKK